MLELATESILSERPFETLLPDPVLPSTVEMERARLRSAPERLMRASRIRDWLFAEARTHRDTSFLLEGLCERLVAADVPIDRGTIGMRTLHSEHAAVGRFWVRGQGLSSEKFRYQPIAEAGLQESDEYRHSPYFRAHQARQPVAIWLPDTPDAAYGIARDLKSAGYVHYIAYPLFFANGDRNSMSFATKRAEGFSPEDIAVLAIVMPATALVLEILVGQRNLDQLLRMYVGDEPRRAILSGSVRRGDVTTIRSAILVADMRNFTRLSATLEPGEIVRILNDFYDCLVPPIEAEGGEVLKYMGDGLLAIFRDRGDDLGGAANGALAAAVTALRRVEAASLAEVFGSPIQAGIALHHGQAAYGNVGSSERLDFTVIGRDVNLTSRIATLNRVLHEPLLLSKAFSDHLWIDLTSLGRYPVAGLDEPVEVFKPA